MKYRFKDADGTILTDHRGNLVAVARAVAEAEDSFRETWPLAFLRPFGFRFCRQAALWQGAGTKRSVKMSTALSWAPSMIPCLVFLMA